VPGVPMSPGSLRTAAILAALVAGGLLPAAAGGAGAIRWLVMGMLWLVFLETVPARGAWHRSQIVLLGANIALGFAAWAAGSLVGGPAVGQAAFFAGIAPTAIAAPTIVSLLRGRVDYVVAAFLLTNVVIAALLPVLLPPVLGKPVVGAVGAVARSVGLVVFMPMLAAWALRAAYPAAIAWPARLRDVAFGAWVATLFLIAAQASAFLRAQTDIPARVVWEIALVTALVCAANFAVGRRIGGRAWAREAAQSLGQKNTTFTLYLALAHANPLVALGPTFYVLWHNLWNTWQLHRHGNRSQPGAARG
jgi:BASS family bile acid:Na+ symporter